MCLRLVYLVTCWLLRVFADCWLWMVDRFGDCFAWMLCLGYCYLFDVRWFVY